MHATHLSPHCCQFSYSPIYHTCIRHPLSRNLCDSCRRVQIDYTGSTPWAQGPERGSCTVRCLYLYTNYFSDRWLWNLGIATCCPEFSDQSLMTIISALVETTTRLYSEDGTLMALCTLPLMAKAFRIRLRSTVGDAFFYWTDWADLVVLITYTNLLNIIYLTTTWLSRCNLSFQYNKISKSIPKSILC